MRTKASLLAVLFLLALAACNGETNQATSVTASSATLNGSMHCDAGDGPGYARFRYRPVGGSSWTYTAQDGYAASNCPNTSGYPKTVSSLAPATTYEFELCGTGDKDAPTVEGCADSTGGGSGANRDTFTTAGFQPGVVSNGDHQKGCRAAQTLGAAHIRMEFDIATATSAMQSDLDYCRDRGVRVLLLAGFDGRTPTQTEANNLGTWADAFGPGGSFGLGAYAVQQIEFGNETSFCYQFTCDGTWYTDQAFRTRANNVALRAKDAALAIAPKDVDLLVQADHGGSGNSVWVDEMFEAVPDLDSYAGGWTVHPYGPSTNWTDKIGKVISQTGAHLADSGASITLPVDVTEYGFSSDDGGTVYQSGSPNNYGWPTNQTYAQAGSALSSTVSSMRSTYPTRLRDFMYYQTHDLTSHGTARCDGNTHLCREDFFGALTNTEGNKGAFTTAVDSLMDE